MNLERKAQQNWQSQNLFEVDAPEPESSYLDSVSGKAKTPSEIRAQQAKWMGTFPYPYMNGTLHLGHAFTISKIEFACGFERMLGKNALFPMGFHLTGLPIKVSQSVGTRHQVSIMAHTSMMLIIQFATLIGLC